MMKRILIVGGGSIGERHLRCFQSTGRAAVTLCETNEKLGLSLSRQYGVPLFRAFNEALGEQFDGVVICTPAHLHVDMARRAIESGASILVEKPLSTTMKETAALLEEATRSGKFAAVAYVFRFHPVIQTMREILMAEECGPPRQMTMQTGQHFPTFRPAYREIYYAKHSTGGGAIQDALTHQLNAMEWLLGPARRVFCDAACLVLKGVEVEDTAHLLCRHGDVFSSYALNQFQSPNEMTIQINCENGSIKGEIHKSLVGTHQHGRSDWIYRSLPALERDSLFVAQAKAFLDGMSGIATPLCSLEEGVATLQTNLAALESARTGQVVDLL